MNKEIEQMETISDKIKRLRKSQIMTQRELANKVVINQATLCYIERGNTENITITLGKKLAKALNISFNELFEIENNNGNNKTIISEHENIELPAEYHRKVLVKTIQPKIVICSKCDGRGSINYDISNMNYIGPWMTCSQCSGTGRMKQIVTTELIPIT